MKVRIFIIILSVLTISIYQAKSNEPFVVLDYNQGHDKSSKLNKDNIFVKNQGYSVKHKIKSGESLSDILKKYYGNSGLNMRIIEVSLIEINKHAFVRKNPNFLYANKILHLPSILEIKNLILNEKPNNKIHSKDEKHIYFFGG